MSRCTTTIVSLVTAVALAAPVVVSPALAAATTAPALQTSAAAQNAYCETSDDLTLGGLFNLTVDALSDTLAGHPEQQQKFLDNAHKYGTKLGKLEINRLLVNTPSSQIGGPSRDVDDHVVNLIVSAIMKGHNNGWNDTVQLENITLNEAIESILTLLYFGGIPVELWGEVMPDVLSVSFLHIISVSPLTIPKLTAKFAPKAIQKIGGFVQEQLQNRCINTKPSGSTPHVYHHNPKPIKNPNKFPGKQAVNIQNIVDGLSVASDTCRPLSEYTLKEISTEVIGGMGKQIRPEFQGLFTLATKIYLQQLDTIKVSKGIVPMRPDQVGGIIELIDDPTVTYLFTVASSPFDGRAWQWMPVGNLTVENGMNIYTLTADIAEKITSMMWELLVQGMGDTIVTAAAQLVAPSFKDIACFPTQIPGKIAGAAAGKVAGVVGGAAIPVVGSFIADKLVGTIVEKQFSPLTSVCGIIYSIIGGPEWELNVVPNMVPLLFFYPDYIHPVVHGVTRSLCLTRDAGKPATWRRSPDTIEEDAKLAAERGTYTIPADMYFQVPVVGWKIPNPLKRDEKWAKRDKDVPQRPRVFDTPAATTATIPAATVTAASPRSH